MENRVIIILGPTASGKTDLAFELAQKLNTEIISADSRQVYKRIDIGSAKPPAEYLELVKHWFINSIELDEAFDAGMFESQSKVIIDNLHSQNKIPIVCGGSGLYIQALTDGIIDIPPDERYRKELHRLLNESGPECLLQRLQKVDPASAQSMIPQNYKRIIRALEVFHLTGKPISEIHEEQTKSNKYDFHMFGINWAREILYDRINHRVNKMLDNGLIEEVENILALGYSSKLNSLNTVGYKEIISFLKREITFDMATHLIKRNSRHYAKRQMTWFNKNPLIQWHNISSSDEYSAIANVVYSDLGLSE